MLSKCYVFGRTGSPPTWYFVGKSDTVSSPGSVPAIMLGMGCDASAVLVTDGTTRQSIQAQGAVASGVVLTHVDVASLTAIFASEATGASGLPIDIQFYVSAANLAFGVAAGLA